MNRKTLGIAFTSVAILASNFTVGCGGPRAVRGTDVEGIDEEALGTGLDRKDLERMLTENLNSLNGSAVLRRWEAENRPTVAVLNIHNETTEHIDGALSALISDVETSLVNAGHVRVVSVIDQPELIAEVRAQQGDAFDRGQVAQWGRQIGARYFVTGKVHNVDEKQGRERRVQYFLFMRVLEAATGELLWQSKANVTKGIL